MSVDLKACMVNGIGISGHRYNNDALWNAIHKCNDDDALWNARNECAVELISESEKARAERMVRECQTEEEILLDQFKDSLYNNGERFANSNDGTSASGVIDLTESNTNGENNDGDDNFCDEHTFELDPVSLAQELDLTVNEAEED